MSKKTIFTVVILVGMYVCFQLVADVSASKIVQLGGLTIPAGTFVFALTFTWRDMLHKRLGKEWAQAAIWMAALANVFMALYFMLVIHLPGAAWIDNAVFAAVLGVVPRVAIASIIAELVSELLDTEVYHVLIERIPARHQWARVLVSNAVSLPVDSVIFVVIAFAGTMPLAALASIALGQIVFKALVTVVSLPLIYAVPDNPITVPVQRLADMDLEPRLVE